MNRDLNCLCLNVERDPWTSRDFVIHEQVVQKIKLIRSKLEELACKQQGRGGCTGWREQRLGECEQRIVQREGNAGHFHFVFYVECINVDAVQFLAQFWSLSVMYTQVGYIYLTSLSLARYMEVSFLHPKKRFYTLLKCKGQRVKPKKFDYIVKKQRYIQNKSAAI